MNENTYTFSVDDALQQAFNQAAAQQHLDAAALLREYMRNSIAQHRKKDDGELHTWIQALGGYHPAAEIDIEFEHDKKLSPIGKGIEERNRYNAER